MNMTNDEAGQTVLVSWQYPIAQHVQIGWITLIYELRYRAASEPNNWKVLRYMWEKKTSGSIMWWENLFCWCAQEQINNQ